VTDGAVDYESAMQQSTSRGAEERHRVWSRTIKACTLRTERNTMSTKKSTERADMYGSLEGTHSLKHYSSVIKLRHGKRPRSQCVLYHGGRLHPVDDVDRDNITKQLDSR